MGGTKKVVLAVDDNVTSLGIVRSILDDLFEVCLAKSAEIAGRVLLANDVDLILLDMDMPDVSGMDFLASLKKDPRYKDIPVVFVTSHGTPDLVAEAKKAGARDVAVKPLVAKNLVENIRAILAERAT